ncbi:DBF4-type zinc finger-containing protein 2 [Eudromia elegans]
MGTSSLMERFLQDVLQHHPHRYHDSRPTYDDIPLPVTPETARDACLSPEDGEKKNNRSRQEVSSNDQEFISERGSSASCKGTKETFATEAFIQKLGKAQEHIAGISQPSVGICSSEKRHTLRDTQIADHSHEGQFTAVNPWI